MSYSRNKPFFFFLNGRFQAASVSLEFQEKKKNQTGCVCYKTQSNSTLDLFLMHEDSHIPLLSLGRRQFQCYFSIKQKRLLHSMKYPNLS